MSRYLKVYLTEPVIKTLQNALEEYQAGHMDLRTEKEVRDRLAAVQRALIQLGRAEGRTKKRNDREGPERPIRDGEIF